MIYSLIHCTAFGDHLSQEKVLALGAEKWKEAAGFGLVNKLLNQKDMGILATAAVVPEKIPSEKQCIYLVKLLKRLEFEGLTLYCGGNLQMVTVTVSIHGVKCTECKFREGKRTGNGQYRKITERCRNHLPPGN